MQIRRFTGPDTRDAMRQIRDALGPDAVILDTHRSPDGIEISAAMDFDPAAYDAARSRGRRIDLTDSDELPASAETAAQSAGVADAAVDSVRQEMRGIRTLLEAQLSRLTWDNAARRNPETAGVMRNLAQLGMTPDIIEQLTTETRLEPGSNPWTAVLCELVEKLPVCAQDPLADGGVFAVVGPTGVGKTTSIAKLAARYLRTGKPEDVALITTDTYRIGAKEQLETFARLLEVPVFQANDAKSLSGVLAGLTDKELVLIDTAGLGQRDLRLARQLRALKATEQPIEVLLALPANAQTDSIREIVDVYQTAAPLACILTKIDEAASLGGAYSALMRSSLPLAYVTNGQRVPEDLHFAGARQAWLIKAAVELIRRRAEPISEDYMAENFAEVATHACA